MAPEHMAVLLEFAASDLLDAVETSFDCRISVGAIHREGDKTDGGLLPVAFTLTIGGAGTSPGELRLPSAQAARLARRLERGEPKRADLRAADLRAADLGAMDLPVAVCLRLAAATFTVGEIETLSHGDVMLVDDHCPDRGTAVAVIAEYLVARVALTPAGARLEAAPTRGRRSSWEWSMQHPTDDAKLPDDADLEELPVRLVFELGRIEMTLGEIRRLAPGTILPLARPRDDALDIVANGRRIGRGTLIEIGDSLGVRVTRLFDHD
jgi:type III secretion protein Q